MVVQGPKRGRRNYKEDPNKFGGGTSKQKQQQPAKGNQSRYNILTIEETQEECNNEEVVAHKEESRNMNKEDNTKNTTHKKEIQQKQIVGEQKGQNKEVNNKKYSKEAEITKSIEAKNSSTQPEKSKSNIPSTKTGDSNRENQKTEVTKYKENWKSEDDSTQIQDSMEEDTQGVETNIGEGRPPDPGENNNIQRTQMDTDLQRQIEELVEGVDFDSPMDQEEMNEGQIEAAEMQLA
ncbi:hypothetical protein PIB30_030733 [Stylosanthes scabra]|uniref:Uncharacterized protein n=1 Tax=Stylosanthes scabra TaxID=79078 RepID=A0ABU6VBS9_9FABA|nr:hypothetical protein [Stylosanthes scabra]